MGPFGTSQMPLVPAVFCLSEMPRRLLEDEAPQLPVVAVLQALADPDAATVATALRALSGFPEELRELCFVAIERAAPEAFRHSIEEESMIAEYLLESEFFRRHYGRGKEEGLAEGLAEGEARAREGALALHRGIALELMRSKLPQVSGEHESRLQQLSDEAALARLIVDLGRAADAEQAQAAWALALDRSARRACSTSDE